MWRIWGQDETIPLEGQDMWLAMCTAHETQAQKDEKKF